MIRYYNDLNLVNSGNYFINLLGNNHFDDNNNEKEDFIRYMNQFSLMTLNMTQQS